MSRERAAEGQGNPQGEIRAEWLKQSQEGVWVFSRREIGEAFSWYKRKRKPKQPTGPKPPYRTEEGPIN
jgi:hypothetical protein